MKLINKIVSRPKWVLFIFLLFALVAVIQGLLDKGKVIEGIRYTSYNNYVIFKQSFYHLIENKDLYISYPQEQWDLYKYSPTFSLLFGVFALLPDFIGLTLWDGLNTLMLLFAVYYLPRIDIKVKGLILLSVLIELMTSLQNHQSNGLIAGLIILTFGLLEREKYALATLCVVSSIYIKLFGIIAVCLFIFYPGKWKLSLYMVLWSVLFLFLPLLVIDIDQLKFLYQSWKALIDMDQYGLGGLSVMGWFRSWFHLELNNNLVLLGGLVLLMLPLIKVKKYSDYSFRLIMLASVLIWVVIFNHKAESPTFVIAMAGVSIFTFSQKLDKLNLTLFFLAFLFTSLSPTDIFPPYIRNEFVKPYVLKGVACIIVWLKLVYDMLFDHIKPRPVEENHSEMNEGIFSFIIHLKK